MNFYVDKASNIDVMIIYSQSHTSILTARFTKSNQEVLHIFNRINAQDWHLFGRLFPDKYSDY